MRSFADAFVAFVLVATLAAIPIVGVSLAQQRLDLPMTEAQMSRNVANAFNERFGALYARNPLSGDYEPVATVAADEFSLVADDTHFARFVRNPLVGMTVRATVDKTSGLIAFAAPEFAYE